MGATGVPNLCIVQGQLYIGQTDCRIWQPTSRTRLALRNKPRCSVNLEKMVRIW